MKIDMNCPKCGSENTTRVPIELLDGVKGLWYGLIVMSLFGMSISPVFLLFSFVLIGIVLILNVTRKIAHKNEWIMQCSRCGTEFAIVNPDRADKLQEKGAEKQIKAEKKAVEYKNAAQLKKECLSRNGKLVDGEKLLQDIDYFGFHKNTFSNSQGKLRITDKSLICYNDKGCFRISRDKIVAVKKKNYFLFIPTGIQIRVNDKRKKYNFVVYPKDRAEILTFISK